MASWPPPGYGAPPPGITEYVTAAGGLTNVDPSVDELRGFEPTDHADAVAAVKQVAIALNELFAPQTTPDRRAHVQGFLHKERETHGSSMQLRSIWRRVMLAQADRYGAPDETILWFALSTCESSLKVAGTVPAAERVELKHALTTMLLGERAATLPYSATSKAVQIFAALVRASWPVDEPGLLHDILDRRHTDVVVVVGHVV